MASARTVFALILREMSTTYGRSPGGYLWTILDPVLGIALLTLVFSLFFHSPALGTNFALFYATGILPFNIYMNLSTVLAQALNFSRPLLAYPAVTWVDALIARFLLNFLTQILIAYILLFGILAVFETRVTLDIPVMAEAILLAGFLGLGVGTLNCVLISRFDLWQRIWSILNRPLFLVSGIMFLLQSIPQPWRDLLWYNPLIHITGLMRRGVYTSYDAPYVSTLYVAAISAICLVTGLIFLAKYHRDLINL